MTISKLFSTLPVRHREFERNIKKEFHKLSDLVQAYCLVCTGVKFICTNQQDKGYGHNIMDLINVIDLCNRAKSKFLQTSGSKSMRDNIISIYGPKHVQSMVELSIQKTDEAAFAVRERKYR